MNNKLLTLGLLMAVSATTQAEVTTSHLERVIQKGSLNVCTTGDYKPYTYLRSDGHYEGIDIAMAESLAASLGVKVNWVPTTWKTMMEDMTANRCDIAMGGISVTLPRQQKAWFTSVMDQDGKIPFVRCENVKKYQSVQQLNKPSVSVIEPAGGTNEAFVHAYLPDARLILSHDNQAIFQQLVDKKADVMITDASEALFQQKHYPKLCAVNPKKPLQYGEKAYLLPKDDVSWKMYVDQWLHLSQANGDYQKIVGQWLAVGS